MSRPLIGQVLSRMGKLATIDVDEILVEQAVTHLRFGEIALSWGLCEPDHLCEAWCRQLAETAPRINLDQTDIESDAVHYLPHETSSRLGVIPIRLMADQLVIATSRALDSHELTELLQVTGKDIRLVVSEQIQINSAIERYYTRVCAVA
jgi:hypothetical protein